MPATWTPYGEDRADGQGLLGSTPGRDPGGPVGAAGGFLHPGGKGAGDPAPGEGGVHPKVLDAVHGIDAQKGKGRNSLAEGSPG